LKYSAPTALPSIARLKEAMKSGTIRPLTAVPPCRTIQARCRSALCVRYAQTPLADMLARVPGDIQFEKGQALTGAG